MTKQWKSWGEQGTLKTVIKSVMSTTGDRSEIVSKATEASLAAGETHCNRQIVEKAVDELLSDWMIVSLHDGTLQVTEEAHESLVQATGQGDYPGAMLFLFEKGIRHPDMDRFGLTNDGDSASDENVKSQKHSASKIATMPSSFKKVKRIESAQGEAGIYEAVPEGAEKIDSAVSSVPTEPTKEQECEFSSQEILDKIPAINPADLAVELGDWMLSNVEQFIDNRETVFRLYLCVNSDMGMPVSSLFQRLYLSVSESEENELIEKIYDLLDGKLQQAKSILSNDKEFQEHLFARMSYFYELTGFVVKDGQVSQAMIQKMEGKVSINELAFDPVSLTTTVAQGVGKQENGKIREGDSKVVVRHQEVPAGYGIEIEISLRPKGNVPLSMY